ncbi:hypothetical protein AeMF1_006179 [Aphanomyces euteiches]|nr:hypothetical protein AeMF1_006179 [Aphanomyces euteiches]
MKSLVTGSGQISYYETGVTPKHEIKVDGSGTIQAGSIVTQEVNAAISGGGSIYSNAVKSIVSVKRGSGDIFLVGNSTPGVISFGDYVPKTAANAVSRYTTQALPAHDSSEVFWFGWGFAVLIGIVGLAIVGFLIRMFGVRALLSQASTSRCWNAWSVRCSGDPRGDCERCARVRKDRLSTRAMDGYLICKNIFNFLWTLKEITVMQSLPAHLSFIYALSNLVSIVVRALVRVLGATAVDAQYQFGSR